MLINEYEPALKKRKLNKQKVIYFKLLFIFQKEVIEISSDEDEIFCEQLYLNQKSSSTIYRNENIQSLLPNHIFYWADYKVLLDKSGKLMANDNIMEYILGELPHLYLFNH